MAKTAQYVEFDVSELPAGFEREQRLEPSVIRPLSFKGQVGKTEGYEKPFSDLFTEGSLTLGEQAALFNVYLQAKRGIVKLTEPQKEYLDHMFDRTRYGNILVAVVDFDSGDRSMPAKEGYRRVLLINRPELLFAKNGKIKGIKGGERKPKLWPTSGYIERTCDGWCDEDGVPFKTSRDRLIAERTWLDADPDKDKVFAQDAVSYAWCREKDKGKAIMYRMFFFSDYGRFCLDTVRDPSNWSNYIGRVPVSRYSI